MDTTTSDDTDTLKTRLTPSKRTLTLVAVLAMLVTSVGGGVAQESLDLGDDFEDGNTRIEYDGWSGWSEYEGMVAQKEQVISGSYSARITDPQDYGEARAFVDATRDTNTTAVNEVSVDVQIDNQVSDGAYYDGFRVRLEDNNGDTMTFVKFEATRNNRIFLEDSDAYFAWDTNTTYTVTFNNFNFTSNEVNVTVSGAGNEETKTASFASNERFGNILFVLDNDNMNFINAYVDNVEVKTEARYRIDGQVTNENDQPIRDGTIKATDGDGNSFTAELNQTGYYSIEGLENDTYTVETLVPEYINESASVSVSGSSATQDFQLLNKDESLQLDVRKFVEHGQSVPYEVTATYIDNGQRVREEVTADAIVTSGNASVVTVDEVNKEVVGTSDTSVNYRTYVQANWTAPNGDTYTDRVNVTVANKTVANFDILPTWSRVSATVSSGTARVIFIATAVGAAVAIIATGFAGLGAMTMVMIAGWILGYVNNGTVIATVLVVTFVGLNVAGNVDYTVRKG